MTFPVQFHLFGHSILAHTVFEILAYAGGFQLFLLLRRRHPQVSVPFEKLMWIWVGCVFGALFGSKLLAWAESPLDFWNARQDLAIWLSGKTIVGGLLGGWIGVEIAKRAVAVNKSTGDLFVFPLIFGIAVGRIGCFLTGLPDRTHGHHSSLPWAVNFGDGPRHPTQLYEIVFFIALAIALALRTRRPFVNGELFRLFMLAYMLFRFTIDFIKPRYTGYAGLSAIQWACLAGAAACVIGLMRLRAAPSPEPLTREVAVD